MGLAHKKHNVRTATSPKDGHVQNIDCAQKSILQGFKPFLPTNLDVVDGVASPRVLCQGAANTCGVAWCCVAREIKRQWMAQYATQHLARPTQHKQTKKQRCASARPCVCLHFTRGIAACVVAAALLRTELRLCSRNHTCSNASCVFLLAI